MTRYQALDRAAAKVLTIGDAAALRDLAAAYRLGPAPTDPASRRAAPKVRTPRPRRPRGIPSAPAPEAPREAASVEPGLPLRVECDRCDGDRPCSTCGGLGFVTR